jgi:soluble lytic murein transglycosylase-like protein
MDIINIILGAAKSVGVSGSLLLAICSHESSGFTQNYAAMDKGSPSYGSCQIKKRTAEFLGFKGDPKKLNDIKINAYWAAKYLKYQQNRYGDNWLKLVSSYNAGSFLPSKYYPKCPKNIKYVHLVQKKLPYDLQNRLQCGISGEFAENL